MAAFMNIHPPPYNRIHNMEEIIIKYEIDRLFSEKMHILSHYKIVLLLDDSGSMNTPVSQQKTRWDELKEVVNIVFDIAIVYEPLDIYFLNRLDRMTVRNHEELNTILSAVPQGITPLNTALQKIINKYKHIYKPILVVIATDGIPTNERGYIDIENFTRTIRDRDYEKFYISFLACSDNEKDVGYLNELDHDIPNIDTLDDYLSEKKEVLQVQGEYFNYTFGDHVVRLLLGSLCPELDALDEPKKKSRKCVIL